MLVLRETCTAACHCGPGAGAGLRVAIRVREVPDDFCGAFALDAPEAPDFDTAGAARTDDEVAAEAKLVLANITTVMKNCNFPVLEIILNTSYVQLKCHKLSLKILSEVCTNFFSTGISCLCMNSVAG